MFVEFWGPCSLDLVFENSVAIGFVFDETLIDCASNSCSFYSSFTLGAMEDVSPIRSWLALFMFLDRTKAFAGSAWPFS